MAGHQALHGAVSELTPSHMDLEVKALQDAYPEQFKVITDVGDFKYVVDVKMPARGLSIKFQLSAAYPVEACHVVARCRQLDAVSVEKLALHLTSEAQRLRGKPMMQALLESAMDWVSKAEARGARVTADQDLIATKTDKKKKKKPKKKYEEPEVVDEKKPSMKTADEVVNRIMWDGALPTECFIVGYLDRFLGVMEKNFTWFSWEDLASVDYDTLAIPKHRIQYFRYKDMIVWEKKKRLDNVFGSVGGKTIYDVIEEYERDHVAEEGAQAPARQEHDGYDDDDDEDSDSDDGIVVNVGAQGQDSEEEEVDWDQHVPRREEYWGPKNRPTHFLCLRVTEPALVETMEEMHDQIRDLVPEYADCLIPPERLHVTLACLGLDTRHSIDHAAGVIKRIGEELADMKPKDIVLEFDDVKQFFNQTLYACVKDNPSFLELVDHLRLCVREAGIEVRDVFDYTPHMTILKLARKVRREQKCPYMDGRLLQSFGGRSLGKQVMDNIYLCEMSEQRSHDGFYINEASIKF